MISLILFLVLLILTLFVYFAIWIPYQKHAYFRAQGVAGPSFKPVVGSMLEYRDMTNNDRQLDFWLQNGLKWGKIPGKKQRVWFANMGPIDRLIVCDPDMIQSILKTNVECYEKGPTMRTVVGQIMGCDNLLLSEGEHHKTSRKIIAPAFHYQNLNSMVDLMVQQTERTLSRWNEMLQQQSGKAEVEIHHQMSDLTLNIVAACVFGSAFLHSDDVHAVIYHTFNGMLEEIQTRTLNLTGMLPILRDLPLPSKLRINEGMKKLRHVVDVILDDRQKGNSKSACSGADLLDLLLSATDEETGQSIPVEQIKQEALTFIFAGHDTLSNLLTWCIRLLLDHPDIYQRCRSEIDSLFPDGESPTPSSLSSMHYLDAVLHETARIYPPAPWFNRQCIKENVIGTGDNRVTVPKGGNLMVSVVVQHHDPTVFPNPEVFDPERWLKKDPSQERRHPFAYIPFSAGQRGCIGNNFAMMEAKVILAMMVQRFDLTLIPGQKFTPLVRITMRPKYGLRAEIRARETKPKPNK